ncbi:MAG: hypothetical protein SH850_21700 [Planctomycetaceae bacterium]|nr:hypothetical protein [Planctomycetaceae bacterium]
MASAYFRWNPPHAAHIGGNDFTTYCVHDEKTAAYIIAYRGDFGSSSDNNSNSKTHTWNEDVKLTLKTPAGKKEVSFRRDHTAPDKLTLAGKDYDLKNGRLLLLNADGAVRQLAIEAIVVRDAEAQTQLKKKIAAVPPQARGEATAMKTGIHCQKFREEDAKRPGGELMGDVLESQRGEDPLVLGMRVASDAKWNIGGQARVELVVRNASGSDVQFPQTPRADNGLSVVAIDKDGKEHQAEIAQVDSWLVWNHLLLPRSHIVMVKSFTLRFDPEKRGVSKHGVAAFHIPPGNYKLRCKWNDARPEVAHDGEWTGELVSVEHKFNLAAAVATPPASETPKTPAASEPAQKVGAKLPGRLFVNAGLRTAKDETRFSQSAIAIDPNTGSWTRLQEVSKSGFTVPLSPVRVSPDGKTMLFMREREIWKCDATTGDRAERMLEKGSPAAWSPDGKTFIAVVETNERDGQLVENWIVSADGQKQSVLVLPKGDAVEDWSADGQWLAVRSRLDRQIYLVKPDGSGRRRLADSVEYSLGHSSFSPDSRRIVYLSRQTLDDKSRFSLRTINIDGTGDREILGEKKARSTPDSAIWTAPMAARWSPDGKHLAIVLFDHTRDGGILAINGNWRLAMIDADGGNLRELKLEGMLTTVLPWDGPEWRPIAPAVVTREPKPGAQLKPATEQKLKWGEPANGLRMALAWPPSLGEPGMGDANEFFLVVQNVSETAVRLAAGDDAPNPRRLMMRENGRPLQAISDLVPTPGDWLLQPREVAFFRLYQSNAEWKDGRTISSAIEQDIRVVPRYSMTAEMTIEKAPAGAWTGKLITGQTRGSADVAAAPAPMHKDARALYEVWQRYARANGDIPGALVGELAAAVRQFIRYNPTWETVPKLNAILPRLDATHDWKSADAIALLDEIAAVKDSPLTMAVWKGTMHTIRKGEALPAKFADAAWSGGQAKALRAAWVLEPGAAEHRIGAALKARLLVWNPGAVPVVLQVPTWHQGGVKATDAKGAEIEVSGISWTTLAESVPARLGPGEYIEINTPGVGFGPRAGMGPWAGPRVGSNVLAKPGDDITLTHSPVPLDGSEVGVREDDPHVVGAGWWLAHIKSRLSRELPLPADAAERTHLLDRAVRELFATAPTAEETAAFVADKTPDALETLVQRLAARADVVSFSGALQTAPATFRVLAADANADKQPRVVLGPGEYPLSQPTLKSGNATLKIVGRPVGDRRTNDAQILFEATEATGILAPDPHKLEVPDGWGTWAIVCRPGEGFFYLLHKGGVRKIDYSNPAKVTDNPANDLPAEFRDEVKRQFDIHEVSSAQQAEIFEKPAAPATTPASAMKSRSPTATAHGPPRGRAAQR